MEAIREYCPAHPTTPILYVLQDTALQHRGACQLCLSETPFAALWPVGAIRSKTGELERHLLEQRESVGRLRHLQQSVTEAVSAMVGPLLGETMGQLEGLAEDMGSCPVERLCARKEEIDSLNQTLGAVNAKRSESCRTLEIVLSILKASRPMGVTAIPDLEVPQPEEEQPKHTTLGINFDFEVPPPREPTPSFPQLLTRICSLKGQLEPLKTSALEFARLSAQADDLRAKDEQKYVRIAELEEEIAEKDQKHAEEVEKLQCRVKESEEELVQAKSSVQVLSGEVEELRARLDGASALLEVNLQALISAQEKASILEKQISEEQSEHRSTLEESRRKLQAV